MDHTDWVLYIAQSESRYLEISQNKILNFKFSPTSIDYDLT